MRQVITVSLNGRAYQLEDDAAAAVSAYLEQAVRALAGNLDREEIIADLEQAIADKLARVLTAHKNVVTRVEAEQALAEMGPVDGDAGAPPGPAADAAPKVAEGAASPGAPKRLYQISEGAMLSGVCNGIAAYFAVDVTLVRVAFVVLGFLTGGAAILVYLVLMFVVPYANTSEEHAAARGLPFNARVLVERAKQKAADLAQGSDWRESRDAFRREWRDSRAQWRGEWRRARAEWRAQWRGTPGPPPGPAVPPAPVPLAAHMLTGIVLAVLGFGLTVFTVLWIVALVSLVTTGAIVGWALPFAMPWWVALIAMILLYNAVAWPIKALRRASYGPGRDYHAPWIAAWDGVASLALIAALAWYGYHHVPQLREFVDHFAQYWDRHVAAI